MLRRDERGFTLIEVVVAFAILAVLAAFVLPNFAGWMATQRLKQAARSVADAFLLARAEAIRTNHRYVVFFETITGEDLEGNPLLDAQGNPAPVLVLDDGPAATADCEIDSAELTLTPVASVDGVSWGVTKATAAAPLDDPAAVLSNGTTFLDPAGNDVNWVAFRPDGVPVGFDDTCTFGQTGSGGGSVYVTDGRRDYAVTLSPLGAVRIHAWEEVSGSWTN
jgi:prepilin-type N-terminal cleavage/methylation domain-containing protein